MGKSRNSVVVTLVLSGALAVGLAHAGERDPVQWSVTIGAPGSSRVNQAYMQPAVVVHAPGQYRRPTRWDRDGDGVPNRRDRLYNPRWDRDGDGIPNRHDRYGNGGRDHGGGAGGPQWHDRSNGHGGQRRP